MLWIAAAEAAESSKTLFYIVGGLLAGWAVLLAVIGMSRAAFPATTSAARGVGAVSAVLVLGAMAAAVITA
jgi:hypothetical protein